MLRTFLRYFYIFRVTLSHADRHLQEDDKPFTVRLSDESFETYELDPPPYTLETTKKELKQMYYDMVAIRYV
jgi:pyruvate dehydrogenase E1 component alpha subunit